MYIFYDNKKIIVEDGASYYDALLSYTGKENMPYLVSVNGIIKELRIKANDGDNIKPLYYDNEFVKMAYQKTASFILFKVINDIFGNDIKVKLKFKMYSGYFFESTNKKFTDDDVKNIKNKFDEIVKSELVVEKETFNRDDAFNLFKKSGYSDTIELFRYDYRQIIKLRKLNSYLRYINGKMLYHTGFIKNYDIVPYKGGLLLLLPDNDDINANLSFAQSDKYFTVQETSHERAKKLDIESVGKLNNYIISGNFNDLVMMAESLQDNIIGNIANEIYNSKRQLVFISGPSSSGKTSFSHRLKYHLMSYGIKTHTIAMDNFSKERVDSPKDENGEYNFEIIEAMDTELISNTFSKLLKGEEVELPTYNFKKGVKEYRGDKLKIKSDEIVIFEGIHCLNPALVPSIDSKNIYKIFITALMELCIDDANRIATSDLRLLRRIVRDNRTRGFSAKDTIKRWDSVKRGEGISIFPYQENADFYFNSSLIYEINILKTKVMPLLYAMIDDPEISNEARRLISILKFFMSADVEAVPPYSLAKEFIGGSILNVT